MNQEFADKGVQYFNCMFCYVCHPSRFAFMLVLFLSFCSFWFMSTLLQFLCRFSASVAMAINVLSLFCSFSLTMH